MGNQQVATNQNSSYYWSQSPYSNNAQNQNYKITYHSHPNIADLLRIFRLFVKQPYLFINSIQIEMEEKNCCNRPILKVRSPFFSTNLDILLGIKRKNKGFFVEKQIWYILKCVINILAYMQINGTVLGVISAKIFNLDKGRFLTPEVLHLMPGNEHEKNLSFHNYYSPQKLKQIDSFPSSSFPLQPMTPIDLFKSEVFSFALLILEVSTCPMSKPKFHKANFKQLIWSQIGSRFQTVQQRYSPKLTEILEIMLREDVRIRPDWNYLRIWMTRNQPYIDIAPCIFWSV